MNDILCHITSFDIKNCWLLIDLMGFLNSSVYQPLKLWGLENLEMVIFPGLTILEILEGSYPLGSCILRVEGGRWSWNILTHKM